MVSFPWVLQEVKIPVSWCPAVVHNAGIREHFMYRHFRSKVVVVQEGAEPLPCCDLCGMHMPAGRLIRHRKTARCDKNTQMMWRRQYVAIAARYSEATFSLTGEKEAEQIEGVEVFKYLRRLLDRSDDDWLVVLRNISKAMQVWGRLGKLLQREGAEPAVSAKFYRAVVQAVLLFGVETRVLSAPMMQRLEGAHVSFLRQVTQKQATQRRDGSWRQMTAEAVLQGAGTQSLRTYVDRRQATVADWLALRPIFDIFARETGYERGGRLWLPWWR